MSSAQLGQDAFEGYTLFTPGGGGDGGDGTPLDGAGGMPGSWGTGGGDGGGGYIRLEAKEFQLNGASAGHVTQGSL